MLLRACFLTLMWQTEAAFRLLEEAIHAGHWYGESQLRNDPDLARLRDLPAFEALVSRNARRAAEMQALVKPHMVVIEPERRTASPLPVLVVLHGNNMTPENSADYWRSAAALGWLVALPRSTQLGMADHYIWNDLEWATRDVYQYIEILRQEHPIDADRMVIGGFSMGGQAAAWMSLSGAVRGRGFIIAAAPHISDPAIWEPICRVDARRGLRGVIIAGERDSFASAGAVILRSLLERGNVPCRLHLYPEMGHVYPQDFKDVLREGLTFILGSQ
jgi:poly(3-hydroxybutyrate) depolymerase